MLPETLTILRRDPAAAITPEQFAAAMRNIFRGQNDQEGGHLDADELICKLLESLGYGEGVKVFRAADKWYA